MIKVTEQQLSLNKLCKFNGFTDSIKKDSYSLYEMGQTFAV